MLRPVVRPGSSPVGAGSRSFSCTQAILRRPALVVRRSPFSTEAKPAPAATVAKAAATPAPAAPAAATAAAAAAPDAPVKEPKRGPTPRRSRIKFPPEALERYKRAYLLRQTIQFWKRYFEEQRRAELGELTKYREGYRRPAEGERKSLRAKQVAVQQLEVSKIVEQIKADKQRIARSAAQLKALEDQIDPSRRRNG